MTRRTTAAGLAVAIAATLALSALPPAAFAHARYKSSTPGTGEAIASSPARVQITFSEQMQNVAGTYDIEVTRDRGASVTSGPAVIDDADRAKMAVPLQPDLAAGRYVVNWTNASAGDGAPVSGAFSFYVNTQPTTVDLANDAQLAEVGFEEVTATAAAAGTPGTTGTSAAATAAPATRGAGTQSAGTSVATPVATAASSTDSREDDSKTVFYAIIALAAAAVLVGAGFWQLTRRRRL